MTIPPPIRPTFDLELSMTVEQAVAALRSEFEADGEHPFQSRGQHVVVTVPARVRRFWSPYLSMEAEASGAGARLHGRFSPKPAIWTGFMLSYIALTTAGCFGLMFAVSLAIIGKSPAGAAVLALLFLLAAAGMYAASQIGQRMARDQMNDLLAKVMGALGLPADRGQASPAGAGAGSENALPASGQGAG
ncbi:MAG: hypothetical protein IT431_15175 [Phycisphaerales bacterium]|nr:hypothetical protein [Phycisphaerales bacterium]